MGILMLIITMVCLFFCGETNKERINHLVKEWNGKQIVFPDVMQFTLLGNDTNYLPKSEYKILSTSCGCTSVDYFKQPVSPGDSISLKVVYKADHPEHFGKTIIVYSNMNPSSVQLKITGDAE